jgi:hypothetical protein
MKARITTLRKLHNKVDDNFLDNRIKPRYVVIVADGFNMASFDKKDKKNWESKHYSNVTINLNRYIAKYDYDIAQIFN